MASQAAPQTTVSAEAKGKDKDVETRRKIEAATIGTSFFLNSKDVQEAPERVNQPIPVPSVYQDERGEIHNFNIGEDEDGKEEDNGKMTKKKKTRVNLLYSKAGVMRSGDLHRDVQHDFVFSGKVRVWILQKTTGDTVKTDYGPCQYIAIPPFTPHIFEFLEDTLVAEWWDGPFFAWFYEPYRALVQQSFSSTQPGRFSHYVLQDTPPPSTQEKKEEHKDPSTWSSLRSQLDNPAVWSALAIGITVGFFVGRQRR